jgi:hypothetical protein
MVVERPTAADVAARRRLAACHDKLGRKVTLLTCGFCAREGTFAEQQNPSAERRVSSRRSSIAGE